MYVCICKAVSDRAIRRAVVNDGVVTLRELSRRHGVGTCCGKCVPEIREMLAQVRSTETVPPVQLGAARLNASVAV